MIEYALDVITWRNNIWAVGKNYVSAMINAEKCTYAWKIGQTS